MTNLNDLNVMREADLEHLAEALRKGQRVEAHGFVDSIINLSRQIEDNTSKEAFYADQDIWDGEFDDPYALPQS